MSQFHFFLLYSKRRLSGAVQAQDVSLCSAWQFLNSFTIARNQLITRAFAVFVGEPCACIAAYEPACGGFEFPLECPDCV